MQDDTQKRLLIIDDDKRIRDGLASYLGDNGFIVSVAKNRLEVQARLSESSYDMAILDVMLQNESGLDCLVNELVPRDIPTLVLSAKGESEDRIEGLEKGAADYMVKPFTPKELILRIKNIIHYHQG